MVIVLLNYPVMRLFLYLAAALIALNLWGAILPQPAYAVRCDCNNDSACPSGQECDQGSSAGCTRPLSTDPTGLCKSTSASCIQDCLASGNTTSECNAACAQSGDIDSGGTFLECVDIGIGPCIPTDPVEFAQRALEIGMGVGTLLAVLFLILGGIGVATSGGNPDNLEKAKKQITAAVAGLLFILMSVLILDIIGVSILGFDFIK